MSEIVMQYLGIIADLGVRAAKNVKWFLQKPRRNQPTDHSH